MKFHRAVTLSLLTGLALVNLSLPGDATPPSGPPAPGGPPETPIGGKWWPSEWGPQDQRGAANRLTPARVEQAARLIRQGKGYQLGRLYEHGTTSCSAARSVK